MIKRVLWGTLIFGMIVLAVGITLESKRSEQEHKESSDKIYRRNALQDLGRQQMHQGNYDKAIEYYKSALDPSLINREHERSTAVGAIISILKVQHRYEEALTENQWFLRHPKPSQRALEAEAEIKALMHYRDTGDKSKVLEHITHIKKAYPDRVPPTGYGTGSNIIIADILRLYDTIGALDDGLSYIDQCLEYFKQQDIKRYGEYRAGRADQAFHAVRAAFLQDKKSASKGRATRAIIESKYFPW